MAREDEPGDPRLAAYLVTTSTTTEASEIRAHLIKQHLPHYMIPANLVFLDQLPLSSSGKIDRKALPKPDQSSLSSPAPYLAPRSETESILCEIWTDVLRIPRVSIHANFFKLGGNSLSALKTVSRIRQQLGIDLPLAVVFEHPTIAALALKLSEIEMAKLDQEEMAKLLRDFECVDDLGSSPDTEAQSDSRL